MNDANRHIDPVTTGSTRWKAKLTLEFAEKEGRTFLAGRQHSGPLVIQKNLYPEGDAVCHGIIVHPPGGVAGGDELTLKAGLERDSHALLTTPGAGKWYKANGKVASQHLQFDLAHGSCLEWLPQENILFDGSMLDFSAEIILDKEAVYAGWEIICFGRQAKGERWLSGQLQQRLMLKREGQLIWQEQAALKAGERFFESRIGLAGNVVSASFVVAAGSVPNELLEQCREQQADQHAKFGVTALPQVFSARYIGMSAPAARHYFEALWQILRPWYASCAAVRPRIWNT
jgi:urease accessory protein